MDFGDVFLSKNGNIYEYIILHGFGGSGKLELKNIENGYNVFMDIGYGKEGFSNIVDRKIGKKAPRYIRIFGYEYLLLPK